MIDDLGSTKASKLMTRMVMVAALIIIIAGVIYYRSLAALPFAFGVIITSGLNIMKVRMLAKTVQKVVNMEDQEAGKNLVRIQYLLRYFLTGVVLVAIGLISNYTTQPPFYSSRETYIAVWATLFPKAPEALLSAPLISVWGAIAGIFTLQLSVMLVRMFKLEKDGTNFIEYKDDEDENETDDDHKEENSGSDSDIITSQAEYNGENSGSNNSNHTSNDE